VDWADLSELSSCGFCNQLQFRSLPTSLSSAVSHEEKLDSDTMVPYKARTVQLVVFGSTFGLQCRQAISNGCSSFAAACNTIIHVTEGTMNTKDTKKTVVSGSARPMIAPKNVVRVTTEADRRTVITAARAVITEHRDVIKALAKR
jgi:2-C-methyl-D-erythritol 4-phosphate cytidylyltransferase